MIGSLSYFFFQKTKYSFLFHNLTKDEKHHVLVSTNILFYFTSESKPRVHQFGFISELACFDVSVVLERKKVTCHKRFER